MVKQWEKLSKKLSKSYQTPKTGETGNFSTQLGKKGLLNLVVLEVQRDEHGQPKMGFFL